jgi:hypothetical protein
LNKKIVASLILFSFVISFFGTLMVSSVRGDSSDGKVVSYSWYIAPSNTVAYSSGDLIVVGEVQNIGSSNLGYMGVLGAAYNASGTFLGSAEAHSQATDILPGEKVPFYMDFIADNSITSDLSWVSSVTNVTILIEYAPDTTSNLYAGLKIAQVTSSQSNGMTVTGTIQNTGTQTTGETWVIATFYNSSGSVVSMGISNLAAETLAQGGSAQFTVSPIEDTGALDQISKYSLVIQTSQPTSTPTPTLSASLTPTPTPSPSAIVSTQPKSQYVPFNYILTLTIVTIVALVVAVVAVVLLLRQRHKTANNNPLTPPEQSS